MEFVISVALESWHLLLDASVYILLGIVIGGVLKLFLSPELIARHLGTGRFLPVLKAALFGIPIPLCSCGVLPAAAALKKQGASNGATIAFLVSTPESGIDSISVSYALLDPLMTVARPVAALISAIAAGFTENLFQRSEQPIATGNPDQTAKCCASEKCSAETGSEQPVFFRKILSGFRYAFTELWGDIAVWFFFGLLLSGLITVLVPDELISSYLGGGLTTMLIMLAAGIPLYICASASTPIAAALIMKGVSPGAALVFLLVGPATNMASLSVMTGLLGKLSTIRYLAVISASSVVSGLTLDMIYDMTGISVTAITGQAAEIIPYELQLAGAIVLIALSIKPFCKLVNRRFHGSPTVHKNSGCGCSAGSCQESP
ncbi:MAG: SO_0444 family Cu/Zn efflux transporter [Proteobacteria bacterium]|nr:SO_0444 family Cu/Zn efflux transporter [Pseudomonadota bacterium]MBU1737299.1 SO_0444 family Cu/Zn efflux transporter [Pseudomonadota bacterium]